MHTVSLMFIDEIMGTQKNAGNENLEFVSGELILYTCQMPSTAFTIYKSQNALQISIALSIDRSSELETQSKLLFDFIQLT